MNPALLILGIAVFAVGMMSRIDPTFPQISTELGTSLQTTATLASAFGFAYAFIQPAMGIMADRYGQTKVILGCLTVLGLATLACAFATSFESLMICRVVAGAAAGGIPPASLSLASDLSKPSERQIAISRIIAGATTGYVIGAVFSGALSDLLGWRSMFGASAVLIAIGIVAFVRGLKHFGAASHRDRGSLMNLFTSYKKILLHKTALTCFIGVFVEGACIFGPFPYVAHLLQKQGETRLSIAGIVIAAFSIGGIFYTTVIRALLSVFGVGQLMVFGGLIVGSQMMLVALGPAWQVQMAAFAVMGFGFFLVHGGLQAFVTEVSAVHRGKTLALHSIFYFCGQAIGVLLYGDAIWRFGPLAAFGAGAFVLTVLCVVCAATLSNRPQVE